MGNCTVTILKRNTRHVGRANLVRINFSASYAGGGDTIPISALKIGNRLSALLISGGGTNPGANTVTYKPGATEFANPLLRADTPAGVEVTGDQSAQSVIAEAWAYPYK